MAKSPRPLGPVQASGPQGLLSPGTKGLQRIVDLIAGGRPKAPGLRAGNVGPQTSQEPESGSQGANQAARACMTQHDLAQAPTQAQRKPGLGGARVRSQAQTGPRPLIPRFSPLSLLPCLHLSDAPTARLGRAYPARRVPRCAHPQRAGGRAHTLTQLQRPWRAPLPAGGCGGPRVTATRGGRRPTGPGLGSPWQGGEQRRQTRRRPPSRLLLEAPGRWAGGIHWLLIREGAAAATTQTTAADAALRLNREEPNHRKERCFHLSQSAPALGTPARLSAPLPSNPRTRANQEIRLRPGSRLRDATRLVTPRQLAAALRFLDGLGLATNQRKG